MLGHLIDLIRAQLQNSFVTGGFLLMITGSIIALARSLPGRIWAKIKDQFVVSVDVANTDPLFDWITLWLNDQPYSQKTRRLHATTVANYEAGNSQIGQAVPCDSSAACDDEPKRPKLILSPAKGQHFFRYNGTLLWLSRGDGATPAESSNNKVSMHSRFREEAYTLRIFSRSQEVLRGLLDEVIAKATAFQAKKISAFVGVYSHWRRLRTFSPRKMDSVILPEGVAEGILERLKEFISQRAWYQEMGIPYHLGMLFHGIPGSGKTSIIGALAGELKTNLYVLSLANKDLNDEQFACLISEVPPNSFMVLEDVDAAFAARRRDPEDPNKPATGLTLTGILNALDGFMASEGAIVLMTTNHRDLLDPALIRPGRVDFEVEFKTATGSQLRRLYQRFFPEAGLREAADLFATTWAMDRNPTMAEAQQYLLAMRNQQAPKVANIVWEPDPEVWHCLTCNQRWLRMAIIRCTCKGAPVLMFQDGVN